MTQTTRRLVLPVVHHLEDQLTLQQAMIALLHGADGVFLISHGGDNAALPPLAAMLKAVRPEALIGINLLGEGAREAFEVGLAAGLDMVWTDTPGITSAGISHAAHMISGDIGHYTSAPLFFASVAFKYQPMELNPAKAALRAANLGMVPTTSGTATGSAPELEKIRSMSEALNGGPLAVASGMTPENVHDFLPYVTHYLVATGVSLDAHHFDPAKLRAFIECVHGYAAKATA